MLTTLKESIKTYLIIYILSPGILFVSFIIMIPFYTESFQVIQDPVTMKLYWIYYKGSKVLLGEFDPYTGEIANTLETPSFPFIENIKVRNGVIWFTYQPRLGETVRSLFRMY